MSAVEEFLAGVFALLTVLISFFFMFDFLINFNELTNEVEQPVLSEQSQQKYNEINSQAYINIHQRDNGICLVQYANNWDKYNDINREEAPCDQIDEAINRAYTVLVENNLAVAYGHLTPESLRTIEKMREQGAEVTMRKSGPDTCSFSIKSANPPIESSLKQDCKLFDNVIKDFAATMNVAYE